MLHIDNAKLEILQTQLSQKVQIPSAENSYFPHLHDLIFTGDIQYQDENAFIAIDVHEWGKMTAEHIFLYKTEAKFPYIPAFFSFREAPLLLEAIDAVQNALQTNPHLFIADGHGTAHPRKFGVACWLGVEMQLPSLGCAKEPLLKYTKEIGEYRGDKSALYIDNELVGYVLRTQTHIKPLFVSAGHQIAQEKAAAIILELSSAYRQPEPIRRADQAARCFAKGEIPKGSTVLSL